MAERLPDLADVLHAAEDQRARSLAGTPTDDVLVRTRAALAAARRRRTALAVTGAAACLALLAAAVLTWQPRGDVQPADPDPTASMVEVPGVGPLRRATEDEVRGAPPGSALVLWQQASYRETEREPRRAPAVGDLWFLLVDPDGTVLQVAPAPVGYDVLLSWDRPTATAVMATDGGTGSSVVDVLTGRVVGASDEWAGEAARSPDGTREAHVLHDWEEGMSLVVGPVGGADVRLPLPASHCSSAVWLDDTRLVLSCDWDEVARGSELVLVDAATGAELERAALPQDDANVLPSPQQLADGTVVLPTTVRDGDVCRTRVERLDGLERVPLGEVPVGKLTRQLAGTADRLLAAGAPTCWGSTGLGVWSLDTATGDVTEVLPPGPWPDGPFGMIHWVG
ncbi:hypothetical protein [Cellulomonas xiejunii]|uniref:Lipoprotein LpqB beta-propeller domain-containing protein n=1 Tax=Cellulomonas xiejunii TaxID=2968083 RepID=A0ABY5KRV5_9CELL|nr:hypothetical protein [Cellulomonas xiejunii]MCC2321297.1 hypothetical protein [Cellulomonas xiejunii]UUI71886.1 hypothetical protein NP048_19200 [Cellulomonas xiejunii]